MTKQELLEALASFENNAEVFVEQRIKTGYGEGDVYHSSIDTVDNYRPLLRLRDAKLIGGW